MKSTKTKEEKNKKEKIREEDVDENGKKKKKKKRVRYYFKRRKNYTPHTTLTNYEIVKDRIKKHKRELDFAQQVMPLLLRQKKNAKNIYEISKKVSVRLTCEAYRQVYDVGVCLTCATQCELFKSGMFTCTNCKFYKECLDHGKPWKCRILKKRLPLALKAAELQKKNRKVAKKITDLEIEMKNKYGENKYYLERK